jgi:hypothetical protein
MQAESAATAEEDDARPITRRLLRVEIVAICVVGLILLAAFAKGRGIKTWAIRLAIPTYKMRPAVLGTRPGDFASNVPLDAFIAADVNLLGRSIDPHSLPPERPDTVRLVRTGDRRPVKANVNTSGAGDAIVLQPLERLEPNTQYSFEVTPGVADTAGAPFAYYSTRFTTVSTMPPETFPAAYEKITLPTATGSSPGDYSHAFTCVVIGPDHRLYVSTFDGRILRYDIDTDGVLSPATTITSIPEHNGGPRLVIGIAFDPASTPESPILWVSHGQLAIQNSEDWSGKISRLTGMELQDYHDVIVNLPRGVKDHLNNQPVFGPDGAMYFCQASHTAMGAPDSVWGYRPERLLSAAILRLDVNKAVALGTPLDAKTEDGHAYDPFAANAPLTIYATGIRNAYDLLFHSNGQLYAPINGSAAGGNAPASSSSHNRRLDTGKPYAGPSIPSLEHIKQTEDDTLLAIERGGYYGHPNPLRGEFVLNGGNPTAGKDMSEVSAYPVGVRPDANYHYNAFSFGKNLAPCGLVECKTGPVAGRMLITRYSGGDDLILLTTNARGAVIESITGIDGLTGFSDPLDLVEDPQTGNLYIIEHGAKRLTLARPIPGRKSERVFRQVFPQPQEARAD